MSEEIKPGYDRISDIASAFGNHAGVPKNILDYAADRGTHVHEIIYDLINDVFVKEERYMFCGKSIRGYVDSFKKFWDLYERDAVCVLNEDRLYDEKRKTTGQVDWAGKLDGKRTLIDWKTTSSIGTHWEIQAAGYKILCDENDYKDIEQILFVKLDKDGKEPVICVLSENEDLFSQANKFYLKFFKNKKSNLEME